jgi:hypothetical protein
MNLPNITQAQILAIVTFVAGQAVAFGLIDSKREQLVISIGSIAISAAWKIADAIIRNGRAQIGAAQIANGSAQPIEPPGDTTEAPEAG